MKLLSGMDSLFLHVEQGSQYMHVAGLGIYGPSPAPGGKVSNVTVSSVRGPGVLFCVAGAQLHLFFACRKMVADPDELRGCLKEGLTELLVGTIARDNKPVRLATRGAPPAKFTPATTRLRRLTEPLSPPKITRAPQAATMAR